MAAGRKPAKLIGRPRTDAATEKRIRKLLGEGIGKVKIADMVGIDGHKAFLTRLGLLSRLDTELPEIAMPTQPRVWKKINSATISYGHGMATTPLQTAVAAAALLDGGKLIQPTFLARHRGDAPPSSILSSS